MASQPGAKAHRHTGRNRPERAEQQRRFTRRKRRPRAAKMMDPGVEGISHREARHSAVKRRKPSLAARNGQYRASGLHGPGLRAAGAKI